MGFQMIKVWAPNQSIGHMDADPRYDRLGIHGVLIGVDGEDGVVVTDTGRVARIPLAELQGGYHLLRDKAM